MIVIAGKNNIAVHALNYLASCQGINNLAVVCNKTDKGTDTWQMSLRKKALTLGILELSLSDAEELADVFISLEFDQIIKTNNFKTSKIFNIHFSLLPKYRGMYTSVWPILNNEKKTGVTLHKVDDGIDTGAIVNQQEIDINGDDSSLDLYIKYTLCAIDVFNKYIDKIIFNKYECIAQDEQYSSYYSKDSIDFNKCEVNFQQSASSILRFVRAFSFRPYQMPMLKKCKIANAEILNTKSRQLPGEIIYRNDNLVDISTVDFDIRLYFDKFDDIVELCNQGKSFNIEKILKNIINIDDRTDNLQTLLMISVKRGLIDLSKYLILNGANVNATDYKGRSVLQYANIIELKENKYKIISLLISNGAEV
jgi:methionyl-tRNA formyltransferase